MTETAQMRTWAEISLDRLAHNYQTLRAMLAPDCRFLGLCKATPTATGPSRWGGSWRRWGPICWRWPVWMRRRELRRGGRDHPHPVPGA